MRRRGRGLAWRASTRRQALGRRMGRMLKLRSLVRIRAQVEAVEFTGQLQQSAPNWVAYSDSSVFLHSAAGQRSKVKVSKDLFTPEA